MPRSTSRKTRDRARELRRQMTYPEDLLWGQLRNRGLDGLKFRRQAPVGPYIADFLCDEHRLVVELDGESHDNEPAVDYDKQRTRYLQEQGYRVIRYDYEEVLKDLESVLRDIARRCGRDVRWW